MVLTETNISDRSYYHNRLGYDVVCLPEITTATFSMQGGVGMVIWDRPQFWKIYLTRFHGPYMGSSNFVTDVKRNLLVGA